MKSASTVVVVVVFAAIAAGKCLPISEAPSRVGDAACITGKVEKVTVGEDGRHYLDFCGDSATCPFSAVVPPRYLRDVGDVRKLQGKTIEIYGKIRAYGLDDEGLRGKQRCSTCETAKAPGSIESEMLLKDVKQLRGAASKIPPIPKGYDVQKKGHVNVGQFRATKTARPKSKKSLYTDGSIEDEMSSEN